MAFILVCGVVPQTDISKISDMINTFTFSSLEKMTQRQADLNCRVIDWFINHEVETSTLSPIPVESTFQEFYY